MIFIHGSSPPVKSTSPVNYSSPVSVDGRITHRFTGDTVFQVDVQPKELSVTFWTELLGSAQLISYPRRVF